MRVLLTNDDGFDSPGLQALAAQLESEHEVSIVAPERQQSAKSHAFTLHKPLRVTERGPGRFTLSGTPADCAYAGINGLCGARPDLVISGINHGPNLGTDVHYSGTVAAAREAVLQGVPSIAASQLMKGEIDWRQSASAVVHIARRLHDAPLPAGCFLNMNLPGASRFLGYRVTPLGERTYDKKVEEREDPRGNRYIWLGGRARPGQAPNGDLAAVLDGFVSLTPMTTDPTAAVELLDGWF